MFLCKLSLTECIYWVYIIPRSTTKIFLRNSPCFKQTLARCTMCKKILSRHTTTEKSHTGDHATILDPGDFWITVHPHYFFPRPFCFFSPFPRPRCSFSRIRSFLSRASQKCSRNFKRGDYFSRAIYGKEGKKQFSPLCLFFAGMWLGKK